MCVCLASRNAASTDSKMLRDVHSKMLRCRDSCVERQQASDADAAAANAAAAAPLIAARPVERPANKSRHGRNGPNQHPGAFSPVSKMPGMPGGMPGGMPVSLGRAGPGHSPEDGDSSRNSSRDSFRDSRHPGWVRRISESEGCLARCRVPALRAVAWLHRNAGSDSRDSRHPRVRGLDGSILQTLGTLCWFVFLVFARDRHFWGRRFCQGFSGCRPRFWASLSGILQQDSRWCSPVE